MKNKLGLITALLLVAALTVPLFNASLALAADTGWTNAANNTAQDGDGFEVNPEYAYLNGAPGEAANIDGPGDSHRYWCCDFSSIPAGSDIDGIEVRLDFWLDAVTGFNYIGVSLSWDGGTSWTSEQFYYGEPLSDPQGTVTIGDAADDWGHAWTLSELSPGQLRVLVRCYAAESVRDFYFDWIAVKVYYTLHETICDDMQDNDGDGDTDCDDSDCLVDADGDSYNATPCGADCDDSNPNINPGAQEICDDKIDNDCDGYVDGEDPDCRITPVGGEAHPVNKLAILAPWIALGAAIIAGIAVLARRRRPQS